MWASTPWAICRTDRLSTIDARASPDYNPGGICAPGLQSGWDLFSMLLGVIVVGPVGLARHEVSRERGLSGFDRYSMLSDTVLERFGAALSDLERPSRLSDAF